MRSMQNRQDTHKTSRKQITCLIYILPIIIIILSACAGTNSTQVSEVPTNTRTTEPQMTSTGTSLNTPGASTTEVLVQPSDNPEINCPENRGLVTRSYITSKELPGRLYFTTYLPPCYSDSSKYPVLYLLHGKSYQDDQWIRLGLADIMNKQISNGDLPPFIVVMPYDPGWEDPGAGKYDRAIGESLVRWIDSQYSVKEEREFRAIGGVSRGSGWAFHTALRYPELFSIVGIHSPAFFRADRRNMETILPDFSSSKYPVRVILDVGTRDPEFNYSGIFEGLLTKNSIEHTWQMLDGNHSEAYWRENLAMYLHEYSQDW
jgi:enterochelin esterase-like enzyme